MSDKREQALYWPETLLRAVQVHATRTDRSLSYIVQHAWQTAAAEIATRSEDDLRGLVRGYANDDKRKQTLFFPVEMLEAIQNEAARVDASLSLIAQAAVVLATPALDALPTVNDFPG